MGVFLHTVLFPGGEARDCREAVQTAAWMPQLNMELDGCHWESYDKGPAVLLNDDCCGFEELAERLSGLLPGPVMVLYIYDDDYWGYFLWKTGKELDRFASRTDVFEEGIPPYRIGDAQTVARCFGVQPECIARYLIPWDGETADEYAYESDRAAIGDSWQLADFMGALGFDFDRLTPSEPEEETEAEQGAESVSPMAADLPAAGREAVPSAASSPLPETEPAVYRRRGALPAGTPVFPDALNDLDYVKRRAEEAADIAGETVRRFCEEQYQSALTGLNTDIQAHPERAALYLMRAFCWDRLDRLNRGRSHKPEIDRDLSRALELEPDNIMVLRARCPVTATTNRYKRHIGDLSRLIELDPGNGDFHLVSRAYRYHWVGNDDAARADLEEVLRHGRIWTVDLIYLCREFAMPGF